MLRITSSAAPPPAHTASYRTREQRYNYDASLERVRHNDAKSFGMVVNSGYSWELQNQSALSLLTDERGKLAYDAEDNPIQSNQVIPFYSRDQQKQNTVELVPDRYGNLQAQLATGESLANQKMIYVFLSQETDGKRARLIVGPRHLHHSHLSQGKPVQFAGEIHFNSHSRLDDFDSVNFTTGHYKIPSLNNAFTFSLKHNLNDADHNALIEIANYAEAHAYKKLGGLLDDIDERYVDNDYDVSTVAYGEESLRDRLNRDFPDYTETYFEQ